MELVSCGWLCQRLPALTVQPLLCASIMAVIALEDGMTPSLLSTHTHCAVQVGAHRIRGTTSADFGHLAQLSQPEMASSSAHHLGGAPETDIAAALATLRLSQQQQQAAVAAANGYGSG